MDEAIGAVLELLEKYGIAERTLVIFFSDNGGAAGSDNSPLRGRKATMLEGGIRVPCLVRWPAEIPAGRVSDEFVTALDLFPTLLSASGAKAPAGVVLDGFDMLPVLKGLQPSPRTEMFWERRQDSAARVGKWKWVRTGNGGGGLFDLSNDLSEKRDLSAQHPDVLRMLQDRYSAWKKAMQEAEPRGPFRDY
jgi:arylsulfatase A-like enzyme